MNGIRDVRTVLATSERLGESTTGGKVGFVPPRRF